MNGYKVNMYHPRSKSQRWIGEPPFEQKRTPLATLTLIFVLLAKLKANLKSYYHYNEKEKYVLSNISARCLQLFDSTLDVL